jgi:2-polyprenyl-3-methyl-5-hydroxy-6-metoxy-1,4-benzoquinol methylase
VTDELVSYFYDSIADEFEALEHPADLRRRLDLVFDECLGGTSLVGALTLDAGCGYGPFSDAAMRRGARVVSVDLGMRLVLRATARAGCAGVVADACTLPFRGGSFDLVVSSEMIEHTPAPERAIRELAGVLRGGGLLVVTTPNRLWQAPVRMASRFGLRPFHGLENFVAWHRLEQAFTESGLEILSHVGFHPWPFQLGLSTAARRMESRFARRWSARFMVNQAILARRRGLPQEGASSRRRPGRPV